MLSKKKVCPKAIIWYLDMLLTFLRVIALFLMFSVSIYFSEAFRLFSITLEYQHISS